MRHGKKDAAFMISKKVQCFLDPSHTAEYNVLRRRVARSVGDIPLWLTFLLFLLFQDFYVHCQRDVMSHGQLQREKNKPLYAEKRFNF